MIYLELDKNQRDFVRKHQSHPFKFFLDKPEEFDRLYSWSSFCDAGMAHYWAPKAKKVIDIGCGQGGVAAIMNILWGCEIWLIDGIGGGNRESQYGPEKEMKYYSTWTDLPDTFQKWGCRMDLVHFVSIDEAKNYNWPTVDLIMSFRSCGFHYPMNTYEWLYKKINTEDTRYYMTIGGLKAPLEIPPEFEIIGKNVPMGAPTRNGSYYFLKRTL